MTGIRFDLSILGILLLVFVFFDLLFKFTKKNLFKVLNLTTLLFLSCFCFLANFIDAEYYLITRKRLDIAILKISGDIGDQGSQLFTHYAYIPMTLLCLFVLLLWIQYKNKNANASSYLKLLSLTALGVLAIRGGFQEKPIKISNALVLGDTRLADLALNTPFVVLQSMRTKEKVSVFNDFTQSEAAFYLRNNRPQIKMAFDRKGMGDKPENIILFILESFGSEYENNYKFLNTLKAKAWSFEKHSSNGRTSIEAVPALLAAFPSLTVHPMITSVYATSELSGIPVLNKSIQNKKQFLFMHGARKGSMYFDSYTHFLGFQHYVGKEDYTGPKDALYDWGVHDHAFFDFAGDSLDKLKKPFFASIFSLSSHQPYVLPKEFESQVPSDISPFERSLQYADKSLELFFLKYKNKPWFKKTLFIFTGDHTSLCRNDYCSELGSYRVPLILYHGAGSMKAKVISKPTQHADIAATVADLWGQDSSALLPLGHSVLDPTDMGIAFFRNHDEWQMLQGNYFYKLNADVLTRCEAQSILENNCVLNNDPEALKMLQSLRSYYTQSLQKRSFIVRSEN